MNGQRNLNVEGFEIQDLTVGKFLKVPLKSCDGINDMAKRREAVARPSR